MHIYAFITLIALITTIIHIVNHRWLKLQPTIAITIGAVGISAIIIALHSFKLCDVETYALNILNQINFRTLLLNGLLGFLLFAGALTVDVEALLKFKWEVTILATLGTIASAFIIAFTLYWFLPLLNLSIPFIYCMLFGALISPTDPIAVIATVKKINAPKGLGTKIAGESLFNDGIGLVLFVTTLNVIALHHTPQISHVLTLFLREALGGIIYGTVIGITARKLLTKLHDPIVEILITLCIASPLYLLAQSIEISGPLAMVIAGLIVGSALHKKAPNSQQLDCQQFWLTIDELLNTFLFFLIGIELLTLHWQTAWLVVVLSIVPICLAARLLSVGLPFQCFKQYRQYCPYVITILTWGGLRGALALAMALAIPQSPYRDLLLVMTYTVVIFAIIVQGLSIKSLIQLSKK